MADLTTDDQKLIDAQLELRKAEEPSLKEEVQPKKDFLIYLAFCPSHKFANQFLP